MDSIVKLAIGLLLALFSLSVIAADLIKVNAMNYPAWVVRNYETLALLPGSLLQQDDLLRTGKGGHLLLQLADGSAIKLGESARFIIESTRLADSQGDSLLESSFQVLRGAFRFTSSFFKTTALGHRADVKIGVITAGIRGTDIWGRSSLEQDLVCLIEGLLSVEAEGEIAVTLDQALSFYVKPKGEAALPVDQIDMQKLQTWANETELDVSLGIATERGEWQLVLISLTDLISAEKVLKSYHEKGFAARRISVLRQGRNLHRLLLPGFVSIEAALNARTQVREQLGINDAWVWKAN